MGLAISWLVLRWAFTASLHLKDGKRLDEFKEKHYEKVRELPV